MKAISLWQPWASLIMLGLKNYETRSWATKHRGPLYMHASKKIVPLDDILELTEFSPLVRSLFDKYGRYSDMPTGAILGRVDVVQMHWTHQLRGELSPLELACGDYSDNRFAWELQNIMPFEKPIPVLGHQGLWNWVPPEGVDLDGCLVGQARSRKGA